MTYDTFDLCVGVWRMENYGSGCARGGGRSCPSPRRSCLTQLGTSLLLGRYAVIMMRDADDADDADDDAN
jgi:hypothetical protein